LAKGHVLASSGYLELRMFDDAALALEEIKPEDKTRTEVLSARVALYVAAKGWDMAAAVANHLVKVESEKRTRHLPNSASTSPMCSKRCDR
jgi:lipopolysaccharide biosynthesis regulator YciM